MQLMETYTTLEGSKSTPSEPSRASPPRKKADMHTRSLATRSSLFLHAFTRVAVLLLGACRTLIRPRHRLKIEILDDLAQVQGVSCYEHESL